MAGQIDLGDLVDLWFERERVLALDIYKAGKESLKCRCRCKRDGTKKM
jgi:hypothetical protein